MGFFKSYSEKEVKRVMPLVKKINELEPEMAKLTDKELQAKTPELKEKLNSGLTLEDILPEAFAVAREASKRVLGMRHFDVQLIGGIILHQGRIAEMKTGEGKTLVATLPVYLNALSGKGVHVVTVNDYLAKRDSEWMGKLYKFLGLTVGLCISGMEPENKKKAYAADVTYGTNNEFGFDYLRDNMVIYKEQAVQRELNYAIVDEIDSILIDEARTPLIISGRANKSSELYKKADAFVKKLKAKTIVEEDSKDFEQAEDNENYDYIIDLKAKSASLTQKGIKKAETEFGLENLNDLDNSELVHHINQALRANGVMKKDIDYIVQDGEVLIVDEFTGRIMYGRRYNNGLHQAIEAKEHVKIADESKTLATITFQNYFRMYDKLSGMTGTAMTEEAEFGKIYNLEVTRIPTNKTDIRKDLSDIIYKTEKVKYEAVADEIIEMHKLGRPVLVGTISIEKSELVSDILKKRGIKHNILNAKHHEKEAYIIAQAGRYGAVTIATNMAGRGTDILLGGNPEYLAKEELFSKGITLENTPNYEEIKNEVLANTRKITEEEHAKVVAAGGLHVIGTERHESRRIDNQLRGRAARQGDPGSTRFFLSLEDSLMRIFGGQQIMALMNSFNIEENMAIENSIITRQIASNQKKVETFHFDARKSVLEYDDVMNLQREKFYAQRNRVLENTDLSADILYMIEREVDRILKTYIAPGMNPDEYIYDDLVSLVKEIHAVMPQLSYLEVKDIQGLKFENVYSKVRDFAIQAYKEHEQKTVDFYNSVAEQYNLNHVKEEAFSSDNVMRNLEKEVLLRVVDNRWIDHLHNIDMLRDGIGLRAYGQKNPLLEYKKEAYDLFNNMMFDIQSETVKHLFRTKFGIQIVTPEQLGRPQNAETPDQTIMMDNKEENN